MREESSDVFMDMSIDKPRFGIAYEEMVEEELKKKNDELEEKNRIIKWYESIFKEKYLPKVEKGKLKKVENVFYYELMGKGFTRYGAEEKKIGIVEPIAGVDKDIYSLLLSALLHDREHVQWPKELEPETSLPQHLSPQYLLVDRCTKFVFAPIAALSFALGLAFYLYANVGMAVGLVGIGITSLLLTIVFSITKSALKG